MKTSLILVLLWSIFCSACATRIPTHKTKPAQAPTQSHAQMAENLSNAVQRCVGMGLTIGSPLYETCVKNKLK
jgi:hypothetical protein